MDSHEVLNAVKSGTMSVEEAEAYFRRKPFEDLGFGKIDLHRKLRTGVAEVVWCEGKADEHLLRLYKHIHVEEGEVFGTRATRHQAELIKAHFPETVYDPISRILKIEKENKQQKGLICVCTAGSADMPVAEESAQTAEFLGNKVLRVYDVGVSGLHRLLAKLKEIQNANCIVVVAGMEGALASVIGGLVSKPVLAVPTSVGYGASFHGISALLTMLNSCANGVATLNIDNGFGAGYMASQINLAICKGDNDE